MNILLVRPKPHKDSIGLQSFMICEPLELEYLSSYMEQFGHRVEIVDMIIEKKPFEYFVLKHKPDVIGFTSYICHVQIIKSYAKIAKEINRNCITVVGGVQAEVVPQDFEDKDIDYIVKVNGLKTFQEIVSHIQNSNRISKEDIAGVWSGPNKPYLIDTEFKYPFPDREKTIKYRKKYNYIFHDKCATLKTSFGCPYKCEFCYCVEITQHKYFERDLNDVIEEIKTIKEKNIFIVDDSFLFRRERVLEFLRLLDVNHIRKNYILFGRADFIINNEDVISKFKDQGLKAVFVGIESFKEEELSSFNKKTNVEMNVKAVRILEKYDVECYSGIIVGTDWNEPDFNHLAKWLNTFKMPLVNIQPITPMPGTPMYDKLKSDIILPREKYQYWDMAHLVMNPTKLSPKEFYHNILKTYYKTSAGTRGNLYVLKRYSFKIYFRTLMGCFYITWQYLKMAAKG